MASLVDRMVRASKLDVSLYEEVEADKESMGQAVVVVVLSSVAAGIGSIGTLGFTGIVVTILAALFGWIGWAFLTYIIGTRLLPTPETKTDFAEMMRVLGIIPAIGPLIVFLVGIWMLVAMVIAVRQALDYTSTWRAIGVCLIGFVVYALIFFFVFGLLGPTEMAPSAS